MINMSRLLFLQSNMRILLEAATQKYHGGSRGNKKGGEMAASILIVDDEIAIRKILSRYLTEAGYTCRTADNVQSGKEALVTASYDLLLCDFKMPGETGLELIRHARKHYPDMGRVMITGYGSPAVSSEILEIGVYGYIIKPVTKTDLLITVENALRHLQLDLHMQEYRLELEKKIADQIEKNNTIMNNLGVGVAMFDKGLAAVEMNRTMQKWFPDISPGGKLPCAHICTCAREGLCCDECPIKETFRTGRTGEAVRSIKTDKGEREFRIVASPIFDGANQVSAGIALYEDITEKVLLERDLRQAQKLESVGQLAAGIAHEINTPIQYLGDNISFLKASFADIESVVKSYELFRQEMTKRGDVPNEVSSRLAKTIDKADLEYLWEELPKTFDQSLDGVRRVEKIVRAMKDFSHPGDEEKSPTNINKLLETTITVCRNEWKYVAEMETDFAADLPLVPCFTADLGQVFLNIIVNGAHAIDEFTEGGKMGLGKITITTGQVEDRVQIRIQDSGGGIPEHIRDRVFEPFFTTKIRGKGTGQGLAISWRVVVDKHQGSLSFTTEKDRGTAFIIELPLA